MIDLLSLFNNLQVRVLFSRVGAKIMGLVREADYPICEFFLFLNYQNLLKEFFPIWDRTYGKRKYMINYSFSSIILETASEF